MNVQWKSCTEKEGKREKKNVQLNDKVLVSPSILYHFNVNKLIGKGHRMIPLTQNIIEFTTRTMWCYTYNRHHVVIYMMVILLLLLLIFLFYVGEMMKINWIDVIDVIDVTDVQMIDFDCNFVPVVGVMFDAFANVALDDDVIVDYVSFLLFSVYDQCDCWQLSVLSCCYYSYCYYDSNLVRCLLPLNKLHAMMLPNRFDYHKDLSLSNR